MLQATPVSGLSRADVSRYLQRVQQRSFPELEGRHLEVGLFSEADSFFQSNFEPLSLLTPRPRYRIEVNPALLSDPCPPEALEAVLAHELSHTLDYQRGGPAGVLGIGLWLLSDTPAYEHRTDLQAILRGYGPGLIAYRRWLYARLDPEQLARKRATYYTPEQIGLIQARLRQLDTAGRRALAARWLARPPLTEAAILAP